MNKLFVLFFLTTYITVNTAIPKRTDVVLEFPLNSPVTLSRNHNYNTLYIINYDNSVLDFGTLAYSLNEDFPEYSSSSKEQLEVQIGSIKLFASLETEAVAVLQTEPNAKYPNILINIATFNTTKIHFSKDSWEFELIPLVEQNGTLANGSYKLSFNGILGAELFNYLVETPINELRHLISINNAAKFSEWSENMSHFLNRNRSC